VQAITYFRYTWINPDQRNTIFKHEGKKWADLLPILDISIDGSGRTSYGKYILWMLLTKLTVPSRLEKRVPKYNEKVII